MEPKDKFIAYVDIIGFSYLVAESKAGRGYSPEEIAGLEALLGGPDSGHSGEPGGPRICPQSRTIQTGMDYQVTRACGHAIHSCELSPGGAINLVNRAWTAVTNLLQRGVLCRGYVTRGLIDHEPSLAGRADDWRSAEGDRRAAAFKREADRRGTPYVEIDAVVCDFIAQEGDPGAVEMFLRLVTRDGKAAGLFPIQRFAHTFAIRHDFDAAKAKASNDSQRRTLNHLKSQMNAFVDPSNPDAVQKSKDYLAALDAQLAICDQTDQMIGVLKRPYPYEKP